MRAICIAGCVALCLNAIAQNNIVGWEAYFDADTGPGTGQWFPVTNDDTVSVADMVDASSIGVGFHKLFVRFKTSGGLWSSPDVCAVYVQPDVAPPLVHEVVACEYYVGDVDPGFGAGSSIPLDSVASAVFLQRELDLIGLGLPNGNYFINIRYKSSSGAWSVIERRAFEVCDTYGAVADFRWSTYGYNLVLEDRSSYADTIFWTLNGDTLPSVNFLNLPMDSLGYFDVSLTAYNSCLPAGISVTKSVPIKGIRTLSPSVAGVDGVTTLRLVGAGFDSTSVVRLTRGGESDVHPIDSSTISSTDKVALTSTFDLHDVSPGVWNVVVEIPGDTTLSLDSSLTIEPRALPEVYAHLSGPTMIRNFRWQTYSLMVGNTGNIDAIGVPVWIAISPNVELEPLFEVSAPNDTTIDYDTIPHFVHLDSLWGEPASYNLYGFNVPYVAGGEEVALNFRVRTSGLTMFKLLHWASRPFVLNDSIQLNRDDEDCFIDPDKLECVAGIAEDIIGGIDPTGQAGCLANYVGYGLEMLNESTCSHPQGEVTKNAVWGFLEATKDCLVGLTPVGRYEKTKRIIEAIFQAANVADGASQGQTGFSCLDAFIDDAHGEMGVTSISSFDPNEKYPSSRVANAPYFNSTDPLTFTLCFENADTATAAAQTVLLFDSIDVARFDVSTLRFTHVSFGDTIIAVQHADGDFAATVDLRPDIDLILSIDAYFDTTDNRIKIRFVSLDPITSLPTTDPLLGFLLPNLNPPQGEGFLSFSIMAAQTLSDGDTLLNQAAIVFDENAPILTQECMNIVDNSKPTSQVNPIPVVTTVDSVLVDWSGASDNGPAGVYAYNVYMNVNGGAWLMWKYNTSATADFFHGVQDSLYGFYSVAIDSALNVEDAPTEADTETMFDLLSTGVPSHALDGFSVHPNPSTGSAFLVGRPQQPGIVRITVYNSLGQAAYSETASCSSGYFRTTLDLGGLESGTYVVRIAVNKEVYQQRLIVLRD